MLGFLFGTGCLIGIAALLHGGLHGRGGCHHGFHRHFHRGWHGGWHDRGPRPWLYVLSEELDLTPGQEKAVRTAAESFFETVRPLHREARHTRDDVARTLRAESFDPSIAATAFARHDESLGTLRSAVVRLLQTVHEVLDPRQRERLASWVESHHHHPWAHPYRSPAC